MTRRRVTSRQKLLVRERAGGLCEYCRSQEKFSTHDFSVEHIFPAVQGGETELENLALACQGCNNCKYTKTTAPDPVTEKQVPLFHPRRDRWSQHFAWSDDATRIVGLTPTGRATVDVLKLIRVIRLTLRCTLYPAATLLRTAPDIGEPPRTP